MAAQQNNTPGNTPQIEDEIATVLEPALRDDALQFAAYLRENGLTPRRWFGPGYWVVPWNGCQLCGIHFYGLNPAAHQNGWVFWFFSGEYSGTADQELIEFVQSHTGPCVKCSDECEVKGVPMTFFGKEYPNICYQFPVRIENPDEKGMENLKKLLDFWKGIAPHSSGLHVHG